MASNILSVLPATSLQPWRNSCVPVLRGSCSMAHALRPSSQFCTASPLRTKLVFKGPGRSATARLPSGLHAVKRNRDKSSQENITSIPNAPGLQILGSDPPRVAGGRGGAGGRGSTAGRGDGVGGEGGAGRGRVRRPDRASAPAQVGGPVPAHIDSRSADFRLKDFGDLQEEQRAEERAERRRTGDTRAASYCFDKAGAGRVASPDLRVAAKRSDSGSDQAESDTDRDAPRGAPTAGSGRPWEAGGRTAGGWASGRRSGTGSRGDRPSLPGPGSPSGPAGDAPRGPTPGSGRRRTAGGRGFSSSDSSTGDRPVRPGPGGVPGPGGDPRDLRTAPDLPSLAARLEQHAAAWSREGDVRTLRAAFDILGKMGAPAGGTGRSSRLTATAFRILAAAYRPLVPNLPDAFSCVVPLMACARLGCWGDGLALALVQRVGQADAGGVRVLRRRAAAQIHANLWWALSSAPREVVDAAAGVLWESAACLLEMGQQQFLAQTCSNVLLACARLWWYEEPDLVHHLTTCLAAMPEASCQALANTLYALGELAEDCGHQPRHQDLEGLAERVVAQLEGREGGWGSEQASFIPQHLSNMLLGCAKLGYREPRLLQPLAAAAGQAAHRFKSQGLANSLYALAKLGCTGAVYAPAVQSLCDGVVELLKWEPRSILPQDLSILLWALEALRPQGFERYAAALAAECSGRAFAEFNPQQISNSVWALAKMDWLLAETTGRAPDQSWYEAAMEAVIRPGTMKGSKPQDWSNLLYGLALVRHRPPEGLLRAMAADGQRGPLLAALYADANPQSCSNLLWALAVLGLGSEEDLVDALVGRLGELLEKEPGKLTAQHLATSLWALAVMGPEVLVHRHRALVAQLLGEVAGRLGATAEDSFSIEDLFQLWQVQQELEHAAGTAASGGDSSVRDLAGVLTPTSLFKDGRLVGDSRPSKIQQQVAASFEGLQRNSAGGSSVPVTIISVRQEYEVEELSCRVDVLVELMGGRRVAVEVDGPRHFLANPPHTTVKDGRTQLRDRQLERCFGAGNVVSVPYWEWDRWRGDEAQRQEYLCELLGLG